MSRTKRNKTCDKDGEEDQKREKKNRIIENTAEIMERVEEHKHEKYTGTTANTTEHVEKMAWRTRQQQL